MRAYNGFTPAQRAKAGAWMRVQWNSGAIPRPVRCCACGQEKGILDAHTEDYSEPYAAGKTDEFPLCFRCHMLVHCRFNGRETFCRYHGSIMEGDLYAPFYTRNFNAIIEQHLEGGTPEIIERRAPPARDVFKEIVNYRLPHKDPKHGTTE